MYAPFHSASVNSALALKSGWVRPSLTKRARRQATTIYTASANSSLATLPSCRASTRQGPEAFDALPVEIQLGGVLQAQHDAVLSHPCCGALNVRGQHRFPFQGPFGVVGLIEKSIRPLRFAPIR